MFHRSPNSIAAIAIAAISICGARVGLGQTHSALAEIGQDPTGATFYVGTSHPSGLGQINVIGGSPAYLNAISGGSSGGATGQVSITGISPGQTGVMALAIHLTDAAGPSHSLSSLNDPALADILSDLNASANGPTPLTAYAFANPPAQYSGAAAALSAGEAANGGQTFDILLTGQSPSNGYALTVVFSNEIGNLDGITALNVTDIGATPEPGAFVVCGVAIGGLMLARRRARLV